MGCVWGRELGGRRAVSAACVASRIILRQAPECASPSLVSANARKCLRCGQLSVVPICGPCNIYLVILRPRALRGASRADDGGTGARAERGERAVAPACMPRLPVPRGGLGAGVTLGGMPNTAGGGGWAPMH